MLRTSRSPIQKLAIEKAFQTITRSQAEIMALNGKMFAIICNILDMDANNDYYESLKDSNLTKKDLEDAEQLHDRTTGYRQNNATRHLEGESDRISDFVSKRKVSKTAKRKSVSVSRRKGEKRAAK